MRQRGDRHLHIHFGGPVASVGMLTAIAWNFSYSLMIHGPDEFYDVDKFYLQRKVERAQFVLCISDYCRSQVMKASDPVHWKKLHVVRLGVDPEIFQPATPGDRGGVVEIVCVGRLVPAKGHLILLGAFANLRRQGHKIRLRLIGDGAQRSAMESFIAHEELGDCVILEGALTHEATRRKLAQADIFVLASFAEGVPVALMEAMAMEIPCVSTFVAGIPELIRDGVEGLLVPPSSEQALAAALESLIMNPDLRRKFGVSGRTRVKELYNLEKNTLQLASVMQKCLANSLDA
jgi:glycosyltransferase involved in cell wall biosynthesis